MRESLGIAKNKGDRKSQKGGLHGAQGMSRGALTGSPRTNVCSLQGNPGPGKECPENKTEPTLPPGFSHVG